MACDSNCRSHRRTGPANSCRVPCTPSRMPLRRTFGALANAISHGLCQRWLAPSPNDSETFFAPSLSDAATSALPRSTFCCPNACSHGAIATSPLQQPLREQRQTTGEHRRRRPLHPCAAPPPRSKPAAGHASAPATDTAPLSAVADSPSPSRGHGLTSRSMRSFDRTILPPPSRLISAVCAPRVSCAFSVPLRT